MQHKLMSLVLAGFCVVCLAASALAQGNRAPNCTNGTASGTYGYRMSGVLVGVGPFLVNGFFIHNPDGTSNGRASLVIGNQQIPANDFTPGTFQTNNDCTGTGTFFVAALNQQITYNFIATDGGRQIELLNTNSGIALHGVGRRISQAGRAPSCNNGTILGTYGYRLDGSVPGAPNLSGAGIETYALDAAFNGTFSGSDTISFNGQIVPRTFQGTYKVNSDCTGTGRYTDSLNPNPINFVFVAVDGGRELYFQGTDPGVIISGVGRRVQ